MDSPANMWSYWRDKKGEETALKVYYPEGLAADPELQLALYSIKAACALIDAKMVALAEKEGCE